MVITNLLTNMVVVLGLGRIPTNTPAFQEYVFHAVYTNAETVASKWHLQQQLVTSNQVTCFEAIPLIQGYQASMTFAGRYKFSIDTMEHSGCFSDMYYDEKSLYAGQQAVASPWYPVYEVLQRDLETYRAVPKRWLHATNVLTLRSAREIAQRALRDLGPSGEQLANKRPNLSVQLTWTDYFMGGTIQTNRHLLTRDSGHFGIVDLPDGRFLVSSPREHRTFPMPYYNFEWERHRGPEYSSCRVGVSGLTTNIVYCSFKLKELTLKTPTNYLEMLGLPTNTTFVWPRGTQPPTYEVDQCSDGDAVGSKTRSR